MKMYPVFNYALRHEDAWVSGAVAPRILNLGCTWIWVVSFAPWPVYPQRRSPMYRGHVLHLFSGIWNVPYYSG